MSGLQARLDTAFGGLGDLSSGNANPPWRPAQQNIFRSGPGVDEYAEDEYSERLRREVVSGMAMDLGEEDRPNDDGFMPSTAFCRQLDEEDELDGVDTTAVSLFSNEYRPAPGTEVLEHNTYDQRMYSFEGRTLMEEENEQEEEDRSNNDQQHQPSPQKPRLLALSSRGPSKSNLRTSKSSRQISIKKRVSFTGIPDLPAPWVPPHKRGNFVSNFQGTTLPPSPATSPPKVFAAPAGCISLRNNVPDHVANPHKYTRYEFDEPVLVGGGVGQLKSTAENQQLQQQGAASTGVAPPSSLSLENHVEVQDVAEEERWQGAVGAGIEFRRRVERGSSVSAWATSKQQQQQQPPTVKATFSEYEQEDAQELEDASAAVAIGGTKVKKQYRKTTKAVRQRDASCGEYDEEDTDDMLE
ncbi:hypothetical protein Ndes2526B_g03145 [Nannochloris sp. 'desiccata']|nr:hypothetical protein KSW81_006621 [Chlorella desiccata (nom. nud.)]KAH7622319.1 hypothetical protein NADE_004906 [Chlorella desiccata (nom. nud.)]